MVSSGDWDTYDTADTFILMALVASSNGSISGEYLVLPGLSFMGTGEVVKSSTMHEVNTYNHRCDE